jgi:hypothetical protein
MLINWLNFGPNGHATRPAGLVIKNLLRRLPERSPVNHHVKTLIRCARQTIAAGPHIAGLGGNPCNARGETTSNVPILAASCHDNVVINHYYTKSHAEWLHKVARGDAMVADSGRQRNLAWFAEYDASATVPDERILRWAGRLKSRLSSEAHA